MSDTRIEYTGNIVVHHPVREPVTVRDAYLSFLEAVDRPRTTEERRQWKRQFLDYFERQAA